MLTPPLTWLVYPVQRALTSTRALDPTQDACAYHFGQTAEPKMCLPSHANEASIPWPPKPHTTAQQRNLIPKLTTKAPLSKRARAPQNSRVVWRSGFYSCIGAGPSVAQVKGEPCSALAACARNAGSLSPCAIALRLFRVRSCVTACAPPMWGSAACMHARHADRACTQSSASDWLAGNAPDWRRVHACECCTGTFFFALARSVQLYVHVQLRKESEQVVENHGNPEGERGNLLQGVQTKKR